MHGEDRPNIKTQLIIGALKLAEFPDHISIDYTLPSLPYSILVILGLQVVMKSIMCAISPLLQICLLVGFVIVLYAIVGLQFLNGSFHYVCVNSDTGKKLRVSAFNVSSQTAFCQPMTTFPHSAPHT